MKSQKEERRDWGVIIFIIPVGIILIFLVGQLAIQFLAAWSLFANMRSGLDPEDASLKPLPLFQPILPQILTPMAWMDDFLTPMGNISFPPFIVIDPGFTATPTPPGVPSDGAPPTATSDSSSTSTPTSPVVVFPSATSSGGGGPVNTNTPNPPTSTASATPTATATSTATATATATATPTATPTGYPSTPPPGGEIPPPPEVGDSPDDNIGAIPDGGYIVYPLTIPVTVANTPDGNYELVLYEFDNAGFIFLDYIILGISRFPNANPYYQLFNWGDNIRDTNTIADFLILPLDPLCITNDECDNREIPEANLYPYPGAGILIDAETASSQPPPGVYNYVIIISPSGGSGNNAQVDAIEVIP